MLSTPALWVACAAMLPLMIFAAWSDIKYLKIPNWIPLAVLAIYVVTGLWGMPLERFLWGLAAGAVTLVLFFVLWSVMDSVAPGTFGAGDVKLLAVLVPFIDLSDAFSTLILFTVIMMLVSVLFLVAWGFSRGRTGLTSLDQKGKKILKVTSPFGVALALTTIVYLGLNTWDSIA
ncbi:MAG: prepilin peptidase [Paracoccaceae bacterium]